MNWFEKVLAALSGTMSRPGMFGWFHLMCLGITVVGIILVCIFLRKKSNNVNRAVLLTFAIVFIILEIYKQLAFVWFDSSTGLWDYSWYAFPFQFCSTPMYVALIAGIAKPGKFQNWCMNFLATFGLFAGICVMMYPDTVFVEMIGINIQTMVVHGGMIVLGIYCFVSGRVKLHHKTIISAAIIFSILAAIALVMNIIFYHFISTSFNMFFISPYIENTLLLLNLVYANTPYPVFLLVYLIAFTLAAYLMLLAAMGINWINNRVKTRQLQKT